MLTVSDFDYDLPEELIAQTPLEPRDSSRLLVLDRSSGKLSQHIFREVVDYLRPGDLLIANDTKVIPARLIGRRADSGGKVEVFLLHRLSRDEWEVLVKPGKKMRPGQKAIFGDNLSCEIEQVTDLAAGESPGLVMKAYLKTCWKNWAKPRCRPIFMKSWPTLSAIRRFMPASTVQQLRRPPACISRRN